jgi:hypothetical protein
LQTCKQAAATTLRCYDLWIENLNNPFLTFNPSENSIGCLDRLILTSEKTCELGYSKHSEAIYKAV